MFTARPRSASANVVPPLTNARDSKRSSDFGLSTQLRCERLAVTRPGFDARVLTLTTDPARPRSSAVPAAGPRPKVPIGDARADLGRLPGIPRDATGQRDRPEGSAERRSRLASAADPLLAVGDGGQNVRTVVAILTNDSAAVRARYSDDRCAVEPTEKAS
jgi:hypothetical protein